jgi:hypothetical protein
MAAKPPKAKRTLAENLITSRMPEDLPAFTEAILHQLGRD